MTLTYIPASRSYSYSHSTHTYLSPNHLRQSTDELWRSIHTQLNGFLVDDFPD